MKGVMIRASHQHAYPDDDEAKPFFKLCCDLDVPVVMHPPPVGFGEERMKDYRLASSVGRPADNCLALARLIVRGIFEEFPNAQAGRHASRRRHLRGDRAHELCLHHAGGGVLPRHHTSRC